MNTGEPNLLFLSQAEADPLLRSDGDRIFIFGFSRGAYAARALAGMLAKVGFCMLLDVRLLILLRQIGLLPRGNLSQIPL